MQITKYLDEGSMFQEVANVYPLAQVAYAPAVIYRSMAYQSIHNANSTQMKALHSLARTCVITLSHSTSAGQRSCDRDC